MGVLNERSLVLVKFYARLKKITTGMARYPNNAWAGERTLIPHRRLEPQT